MKTKFGNAIIGNHGYYKINTIPEGNFNKLLHGKQHAIHSVNLLKLKQKVINRGHDWLIINEKQAIKTCKKYGYNLEDLM